MTFDEFHGSYRGFEGSSSTKFHKLLIKAKRNTIYNKLQMRNVVKY